MSRSQTHRQASKRGLDSFCLQVNREGERVFRLKFCQVYFYLSIPGTVWPCTHPGFLSCWALPHSLKLQLSWQWWKNPYGCSTRYLCSTAVPPGTPSLLSPEPLLRASKAPGHTHFSKHLLYCIPPLCSLSVPLTRLWAFQKRGCVEVSIAFSMPITVPGTK